MRRRRTPLLSPEGLVAYGVIPGLLVIGVLTLSRLLIVAGHCAISAGYCP
jgi:hypothetical protein